jgi:methyl-accepting chemotaxis protein
MIGIRIKTLTLLFVSIASCSLILSFIMLNVTYNNLQTQVKEQLSLRTETVEKEIEIDNMPVEDAVNDIVGIIITTFNTQSASINPKSYLPNYLDSISLQVKGVVQNTKGAIGGYVYPNVEMFKGIYDIWYVLENNTFIKSNEQETPEMFYPTNDSMVWYYDPILKKTALWTHVYYDEILKENCISYVKPIIINNVVVGMTGIDASFETKKHAVEQISIYKTGFAFLLDDKRQFIIPPKSNTVISNSDIDKIYQETIKTRKGTLETSNHFMSFVKMNNNQILVITAPKKEVMEPLNRIVVWIFLSTLFIAITVMFVGYFVSKSIVDPIEKLKEFAIKLGNGNLEEPVIVKSDDEVGNLANSFEKLRLSIREQNKELAKYGQELETKVKERTKELENKNIELEKMNTITVDRELKMIELKKQISELENKLKGK